MDEHMSWFDVLAGLPLELCMAFLIFQFVKGLIRSAKAVQAGIAIPVLHLFIAGVIAAAVYQIKELAFGLAAVSVVLATVCSLLLAKGRRQDQLMRHLLDSKAVGDETQWKVVKLYGLIAAAGPGFLAFMSMGTHMTLLCCATTGIFLQFGVSAALYLRPRLFTTVVPRG